MFILYSVDTSFERKPIANWLIFALLVLVFLIQTVTWRRTEAPVKEDQRYKMARSGQEVSDAEFEKVVKKETEDKMGNAAVRARWMEVSRNIRV